MKPRSKFKENKKKIGLESWSRPGGGWLTYDELGRSVSLPDNTHCRDGAAGTCACRHSLRTGGLVEGALAGDPSTLATGGMGPSRRGSS